MLCDLQSETASDENIVNPIELHRSILANKQTTQTSSATDNKLRGASNFVPDNSMNEAEKENRNAVSD